MSNQQSNTVEQQSKTKLWMNRLQLILLFAVFAAPLLGAYYLYSQRDTQTFSTVNNGELYSKPQDLIDLPLLFEGEQTKVFNQLEKKWYLIVVADGACDKVCENNLLTIRQLRRMQGKNINRVVSLFVHAGLDSAVAKDLTDKYSITGAAVTDLEMFSQWLKPFYEGRDQLQFDKSLAE